MNNNLLVFIGVLLVILVITLIGLAILGVYIIVRKNPELFKKIRTPIEKESETPIKTSEGEDYSQAPEVLEEHCVRHQEVKAQALCAICMDAFCESCVIQDPEEKLNFCTEHHRIYANNQWDKLAEIRTIPDEAEKSEYLYKFKNNHWAQEQTPMIITTHYQIDVERNLIESEIKLLARKQDIEKLKPELNQLTKE